ncbi:hypothetical protein BDZ89DRAFT_1079194 [Hymenopellis radicata]|nr:hypothetical protein BDZ89DRAFT_1079194 [Hymenopellis radicata]
MSRTTNNTSHPPPPGYLPPEPNGPEASTVSGNLAEDPPDYATASLPMEPFVYSFSPVSPTSMLLLPPRSALDSRPRYRISVSTNCFTPSSYITTVTRGASDYGELVGEFEMGITSRAKSATIRVARKESYISDVLDESKSVVRCVLWKGHTGNLFWSNSTMARRFVQRDLLAEFCAPTGLRNPEEDDAPLVQLKIYPEGHEMMDDILLSALVMERRRTTFDITERHPIILKPDEPLRRRVWHYDAPTDVNQLHYL